MGPRWPLRQCPAGPSSPTGRLEDLPSLRMRCAAERPALAEHGSRWRQGHGPPRGRGRRPGPRGSPARSSAPTRAAPRHFRPRRAGAPRSIGGSRKPETCQPHSPGYLRCPRRAQAGAETPRARVRPTSCDPLNLSPGAGSRRRARGQGAGGAEARSRAHRRDQWDCSKWPAWAGHNPWRRDGTSEAGRVGSIRTQVTNQRAAYEMEGVA